MLYEDLVRKNFGTAENDFEFDVVDVGSGAVAATVPAADSGVVMGEVVLAALDVTDVVVVVVMGGGDDNGNCADGNGVVMPAIVPGDCVIG